MAPIYGEAVISWVGLCAFSCTSQPYADTGSGLQWVQLGTYQGEFAVGSSPGSTHMYYENVDPCGDYYKDDLGAAPYPYWYMVKYDGDGLENFRCANGVPYYAYVFAYKKGAAGTNPFFYGAMDTLDGRADANIEYHATPAAGVTYFGCTSFTQCDNEAAGIEVQGDGGNWDLCCANVDSIGPGNPPYRKTFNNFWSFKTCRLSSSCF